MAEHFAVDVSFVRLIWVFIILLGGMGIVAYIIAWIAIPPRNDLSVQGAPRRRPSFWFGIILIVLGVFFFLVRLLSINMYRYIWPILLIGLGVWVLFGTGCRHPH